ncbi:MAG: nucleocapsid protein [Jingmen bat rhabdovirus 1]|nr:MAG: nucleocapsid protein [Jingmen bat rhabdovirus 1]WPV62727.1 MAG: nucleocapsid protein [Jingmen bat rhabdovirus 1]
MNHQPNFPHFTIRRGANEPEYVVPLTGRPVGDQIPYSDDVRAQMVITLPANPLPEGALQFGAYVWDYLNAQQVNAIDQLTAVMWRSIYKRQNPNPERFTIRNVNVPPLSNGAQGILEMAMANGMIQATTIRPNWAQRELDAGSVLRTLAVAGFTSVRAVNARPDLYAGWTPANAPIRTIAASNQFGLILPDVLKLIWDWMRENPQKFSYGTQWARNIACLVAYQNSGEHGGEIIPVDPTTSDARAAWAILAVGLSNAQFSAHELLIGWLTKKGKTMEDLLRLVPMEMLINFCLAVSAKAGYFMEDPSIYRYCHVMQSNILCEFSMQKFPMVSYLGLALSKLEHDVHAQWQNPEGINLPEQTQVILRNIAIFIINQWGEVPELAQDLQIGGAQVQVNPNLIPIFQQIPGEGLEHQFLAGAGPQPEEDDDDDGLNVVDD